MENGSDSLNNLSDQLLIAMPQLRDPYFANSVVYMWEHSADGALGIAVNLPLRLTLGEIFEQMDIEDQRPAGAMQTVLSGGPVETDKGFILHDTPGDWKATIKARPDLFITTSRDILESIARGEGPERYLVILGCSGWSPGQLEREIAGNSWLTCPAANDVIFSTDFSGKPRQAAAALGFDISQLASDIGSA